MRSAYVTAVAVAVAVSVPLGFVAFGAEPPSSRDGKAAQPAAPENTTSAQVEPTTHRVYLYSWADLDRLRQRNPRHYARVQKILANASESLCKPGTLRLQHAEGLNAEDAKCAAGLELTSNPPKRQLSFRLDDITYVAIVTLKNAEGHLVPAQSSRQTPSP